MTRLHAHDGSGILPFLMQKHKKSRDKPAQASSFPNQTLGGNSLDWVFLTSPSVPAKTQTPNTSTPDQTY